MKIIIIKLGAKGDVVRTLSVLKGIKKKFPESEIDWIVKESNRQVLEGQKSINRILTLPFSTEEEYDKMYNFDIEEEACGLASKINAREKLGFYIEDGFPMAYNFGAEYYLNTLFDDFVKKTNKKTYQEMMFELAELEYDKDDFDIVLSEEDKKFGIDFIEKNGLSGKKVTGIHLGSSPRWPSKAWGEEQVEKFVKMSKDRGNEIILFRGPDEVERTDKFIEKLEYEKIKICCNNPKNTDKEFFSLVNQCDEMICGDSFSLHAALGLKKKTIGLFFCTSPDEIEGYELLTKLTSPMLKDFFPERMDEYSKELVNSISAEEVMNAVS